METKYPEPGFYYHDKHDASQGINHKAYFFINIGHDSETEEIKPENSTVIYIPLYKTSRSWNAGRHWDLRKVTSKDEPDKKPFGFVDPISKESGPAERFTRITDPDLIDQLKKIRNEMYSNFWA